MKKRLLYLLLSIAVILLHIRCVQVPKKSTADYEKTNSDSSARLNGQHNSANSLDWAGTYKGTLPCADCVGIETEITLNKDNSYFLKTKYSEKTDQVVEEKGSLVWNAASNSITLAGLKNKPNQYFVGENKLIQLDISGNKITGAMAGKYVLSKQMTVPGATLTETYWKLTELMGKPAEKTAEGKREVHIILKNQDNRLQGFAGCNTITGEYELKAGNFISFKKLASTLMACMDMKTEDALIKILEQADNYSINGNNLSLNKARMAPLARFEAVYFK